MKWKRAMNVLTGVLAGVSIVFGMAGQPVWAADAGNAGVYAESTGLSYSDYLKDLVINFTATPGDGSVTLSWEFTGVKFSWGRINLYGTMEDVTQMDIEDLQYGMPEPIPPVEGDPDGDPYVYVMSSEGGPQCTSYTYTGLTNGTTYYFVMTTNVNGDDTVYIVSAVPGSSEQEPDVQKPDVQEPDGPTTWVGQTGTEGFVNRLYNVALTRDSETEGFNDWNQQLKSKTKTAAEVAQGFIFSEEFKNKQYNDTQFVKILYRTMFGREADEAGLEGWVSDLENGMSREYVYHGFAESQEFTNLCANYDVVRGEVTLSAYRDKNKGATGFIARLYTQMLGRKFEDDGIEYWCKKYLTGESTIEQIASDGFLHSQELANQNLSNEEFVTRMYRTFLNRDPEEAGLKDWVGRLERGEETRDSLVYGFTRSKEFGNLKAEYNLP